MEDRTCILITHHLSLCLPYADFVIMLDNGRIAAQGTPQQVCDSYSIGGQLPENNEAYLASKDDKPAKANGRLVKDEVRKQGSINYNLYSEYLDACGGWKLLVVLIIANQSLGLYKDYYLAGKLDGKTSYSSVSGAEKGWLAAYLLFALLAATFDIVGKLVSNIGSLKASEFMHQQLISRLIYATPRFFDTTPIGRITSVLSRDIGVVDKEVMETMFSSFQSLVVLLITLAVISINTTVLFAAVGICVFFIYVWLTLQFTRAQRECKRLESVSYAPVMSLFSEIMSGSSLLRAYNMESVYMEEMQQRFSTYLCAEIAMRSPRQWLGIRMGLASSLVTFAAAVFILHQASTINSGLAGFIMLYSVSFTKVSVVLARKYNDMELVMASVERVHQYTQIDQESSAICALDSELPPAWPVSGNVDVLELEAGYNSNEPVLHKLTFSISHGEKIGVVGRTGAGKSSLTMALLRLIEAGSGRIVLDGINIASVGLETLRRGITTIAQNPTLFNGTVRFNLDPLSKHSDIQLILALQSANLLKTEGAENSSTAAFNSLDDMITNSGQSLSLGQRQLVSLARALVQKSPLVILDEATSAVDFENDAHIQQALRGSELGNSTLICVAHRLSTIIDYDKVLVLHEGKVVEFDTPARLLQKEGGYFWQLCKNSNEFEKLQMLAFSG
ncbi:Transporter of the ATP-binding cassette (ABC) [Coemansia brasiliensis]|uniref:Transporter of the ATP-binding cassette (ABC) n=1 Tax=Coemansia brasiliensis TaxID=2650707 RepID=A0A9W8IAL2_9FUNG|nr:Transporter of the ATP-binding cassette (ABC) [Coemansia brasiliensis]